MDAIEEVKARLSIEDVIGEYVALKRAGRNWRGLSPFTSERTPSFMVSPEKQIWHDFSSGKGGNLFGFIMEVEGLDFKGALELLARKAGVDLEPYRQSPGGRGQGPNKERLYQLLELSTKFYQVQFSKQRAALEYVLRKRQFTKETALAWRLGYAPASGRALSDFLKSRGFSETELRQAGVTAQRVRSVGDMFRDRLMIPLSDPQGRVIGFTARLLADDPDAPKYINTPRTVLYDKSRHVFGLHFAKEAIRKQQFVVVTEGNLDVIASYQANVRQVVAVAGTALTEPHLKALSRFTNDVRLSFDADRAGLAATERAIPIASKVGVALSIITLPSGKDPDELIRQDPTRWQQAASEHTDALDWLMERYQSLLDLSTAQGKRRYSDVLLPIVRRLSDPVEQDHYISAIATVTQVSREALLAKLATIASNTHAIRRLHRQPQPAQDKTIVEALKIEDRLCAILLLQPSLRSYLAVLTPAMFLKPENRQLVTFLQTQLDFQLVAALPASLQPIADHVMIIRLQYEELYPGLELTELTYEVARLTTRLVETYVKQQKRRLVAELTETDDAQTSAILGQVKQLDVLLKSVKGGVLAHAQTETDTAETS